MGHRSRKRSRSTSPRRRASSSASSLSDDAATCKRLAKRLRRLERKVKRQRRATPRRSVARCLQDRVSRHGASNNHPYRRSPDSDRSRPVSSADENGDDRGTVRCPTPTSPSTQLSKSVEPQPADADVVLVCNDNELEQEILDVLGADPSAATTDKCQLHTALASRWTHVLTNGLEATTRNDLLAKYKIPINCARLEAPALNPEIKPALSELSLKKDKYQTLAQTQLGVGLVPLAQAINALLASNEPPHFDNILSLLADTGRLLTDLFFTMSKHRRYNISQNLNKSLKDVLQEDTPGEFLFGQALADRIKTAKSLQKSSLDLKAAKAPRSQPEKRGGVTKSTVMVAPSGSGNRRSPIRTSRRRSGLLTSQATFKASRSGKSRGQSYRTRRM